MGTVSPILASRTVRWAAAVADGTHKSAIQTLNQRGAPAAAAMYTLAEDFPVTNQMI